MGQSGGRCEVVRCANTWERLQPCDSATADILNTIALWSAPFFFLLRFLFLFVLAGMVARPARKKRGEARRGQARPQTTQ